MPHTKDIDTTTDNDNNWLTQIAIAEGLEGLRIAAKDKPIAAWVRGNFTRLGNHTPLRECDFCGTEMDENDPSYGSVETDSQPVCLSCSAGIIVDNYCLDDSYLIHGWKQQCVGIIDIVHATNYEHPRHPLHEAYGILTLMVLDWMKGWKAGSTQGGRERHRQKRGATTTEPL